MRWEMKFLAKRPPRGAPRNRESGAMIVLMALCLTILLGFAALGFDLAFVREGRQEMTNATDAAAHAAANALRIQNSIGSAQAAGEQYAAYNTILGKPLTLHDSDFTFGGWNFTNNTFTASTIRPNAVQVNARTYSSTDANPYISLTFGQALGYTQSNTTKVAATAFRRRNIMLEMDITASFALNGGVVDSTNIDNAVKADVAFLDTLYSYKFQTDSIGLDMFTGSGDQVPSGITHLTPLQSLYSNYAPIRTLWWGDGKRSDDATKSSGIAVCNQTGVSATWPNHSWVNHCWDGGETKYGVQLYAGTNIGGAIKAGAAALVPPATQPWETLVLIVLTDGGPLCCQSRQGGGLTAADEPNRCGDGSPFDTGWGNYCGNTAKPVCQCAQGYYTDALAQADAAAAQGIIVYSIVFGSYDPWIQVAAQLPRNGGIAYNTPDSTQLQSILTEIAGKIPVSMTN